VPPNEKEAEDQDDRQEDQSEPDPLREGEAPPTLVKPMRRLRPFFSHGASIRD
jgi:hypothetical protein